MLTLKYRRSKIFQWSTLALAQQNSISQTIAPLPLFTGKPFCTIKYFVWTCKIYLLPIWLIYPHNNTKYMRVEFVFMLHFIWCFVTRVFSKLGYNWDQQWCKWKTWCYCPVYCIDPSQYCWWMIQHVRVNNYVLFISKSTSFWLANGICGVIFYMIIQIK